MSKGGLELDNSNERKQEQRYGMSQVLVAVPNHFRNKRTCHSFGAKGRLALNKVNRVWEVPKRESNEHVYQNQCQPAQPVTPSVLDRELGYQDGEEKELQGKKKSQQITNMLYLKGEQLTIISSGWNKRISGLSIPHATRTEKGTMRKAMLTQVATAAPITSSRLPILGAMTTVAAMLLMTGMRIKAIHSLEMLGWSSTMPSNDSTIFLAVIETNAVPATNSAIAEGKFIVRVLSCKGIDDEDNGIKAPDLFLCHNVESDARPVLWRHSWTSSRNQR